MIDTRMNGMMYHIIRIHNIIGNKACNVNAAASSGIGTGADRSMYDISYDEDIFGEYHSASLSVACIRDVSRVRCRLV